MELGPGLISHRQLQEILRLKEYHLANRGSVEEHWLGIWRIIFPAVGRPKSVYLEGHIAELLAQLRDYWSHNRVALATELIRRGRVWEKVLDSSLLDNFVDVFLERFAANVTSEPNSSAGDSCPSSAIERRPEGSQELIANTGSQAAEDAFLPSNGLADVSPSRSDPFFGWGEESPFLLTSTAPEWPREEGVMHHASMT